MSLFATSLELFAALLDASTALLLFVKWTAVLALAWMAHGMLAGRNPRWRVALWRSVAVGVLLVAILAFAPPIVTFRFMPTGQDVVGVEHPVSPAPDSVGPAAREAVPARWPVEAIDYSARSARAIRTGAGPGGGAMSQVTTPVPFTAAADAQEFRWQDRLVGSLWSIWLAGVVVLVARLILAYLELARIIRRSSDAPGEIVAESVMIAERLGCRGPVRVRQTGDIAVPCLAGLWRPFVLLPDQECEAVRLDDLRAILAHELTHVRGHDLGWNDVWHLTSIALWFHPLAWRARSAHAAACDAVCDSVAADVLGDTNLYTRTLARLALRGAGSEPCHGLAMARTSDVRRRIESLQRTVHRSPLPRRHAVPALLVASVLLLIVSIGITRAQQAPTTEPRAESVKAALQTEIKTPAGKLVLRAVLAENNEPIEGVSIAYRRNRPDGTNEKGIVTTDKNGVATIDYPPSFKTGFFEITAKKPKVVPIYLLYDDKRHPLDLPVEKELRFQPGTLIGGIVQDESGRPVEGATVEVHGFPTE